jgi:hypothetical protein
MSLRMEIPIPCQEEHLKNWVKTVSRSRGKELATAESHFG